MRTLTPLLLAWSLLGAPLALGKTVTLLPSRLTPKLAVPEHQLQEEVARLFDVRSYRDVRAQVIYDERDTPDHLLVYLHAQGFHRVDHARVALGPHYEIGAVTHRYALSAADKAQQPGVPAAMAACPDESIEFIAFAPNNDALEQQITIEVANAAKAKGLKVIQLLTSAATREAYLNYMTCPKVRGNFYDGDANPSEMTTVDGAISSDDFSGALKGKFRLEVTNIWLACEAYNDPMLSAVTTDAQSKKYAAGVNDLEVGPSDKAAACAMEAALDGQPMTAAFQACYQKDDTPSDQWGFGGPGTDDFWH